MTQVTSAHLGESLGTDFFSVREQFKRLPELGVVGEDIKGFGCAGMSPMACGLVTMELHRGDGSLGVFLGVHAGLATAPRVRRAAGQLPDHPAAAGIDAGGPDRDAAVLPADRPPGRGRPADPHRGRAGQDAQHPQGPRDRRRRATCSAATASCSITRSCGTWWTWKRSTKFVTDLVSMYANAIRTGLSG